MAGTGYIWVFREDESIDPLFEVIDEESVYLEDKFITGGHNYRIFSVLGLRDGNITLLMVECRPW